MISSAIMKEKNSLIRPIARPKVSIIIPVYNEAGTLQTLLSQIENLSLNCRKEIILVDDKSADASSEIISSYTGQEFYKTVFLPQRSGKGRAVREALKIATGDIIIIQDGDLEYSPADYPELLKPLLENDVDFVIGSRRLSAKSWRIRSELRPHFHFFVIDLGAWFLAKIFGLLYQVQISDPLSMFKIFRRKHLLEACFHCEGFDFDWELLCRLVRSNARFKEVPVAYHPRTASEGKKLRAFREGLRALRVMIRL